MMRLGKRHLAVALRRETVLWERRGYAAQRELDVIVIGGGPGGYFTAFKAAQLGLKTTCIEMPGTLGGSCSGLGCIPSPNTVFLHNDLRLNNPEEAHIYKMKNVDGFTCPIDGVFCGNRVQFLTGIPKIISASKVGLEFPHGANTIMSGKNIVLAPKSSAISIAGCQIDEKKVLSPAGALLVDKVPTKAVILGAGYTAIEMASVWNQLGSEVVLIGSEQKIAPCMDDEFRKMFLEVIRKKGINLMLSTKLLQVDTSVTGVRLLVKSAVGREKRIEADLLVMSYEEPDIDCLGIDNVDVKKDQTKKIIVDNKLMTSCPGIFAIGNCTNGPLIPHKAEEDGICCANIIAGREVSVNYDFIPSVIYALPEIAYVGYTEEKLKASGVQYTVCKFELLPKAIFKSAAPRILKVLCEKKSGKAVGMHLMGPDAGDMVRIAIDSMRYGASSAEIVRACNSDSTREAVRVACFQVYLYDLR